MRTSPIPIQLVSDQALHGLPANALARSAARHDGRHIRLCRGAYAVRNDYLRLSSHQRHLVKTLAMLASGRLADDGTVVARESAALLHGLPLIGPVPEKVQTVRRDRRGGRQTPDLRTLTCPEDHESTAVEGGAVSSLAQTLVDLGRRRPLTSNLASLDHALRAGALTKEQVLAVASRHPRSRGNARLLSALAAASPLAESPGESLSRAVMLLQTLPEPELQVEVKDGAGAVVGRVDFLWRELGVIGEFDGEVKYTRDITDLDRDDVVAAERRRELLLERVTGWRVVRWTWGDAFRDGGRGMLAILAEAGVLPVH